jgi:hypothetical protein
VEFHRKDDALLARRGSDAEGRVDLLSVLSHELGHALGEEHDADGVMHGVLRTGERVTPLASSPATNHASGHQAAALMALAAARSMAPSLPAGQRELPALVIDWSLQAAGAERGYHASMALEQPRWLQDFVSYGGQDESARNPNAKLKVRVPLTADVSPPASSTVAPSVKLL